jgi:hypothetical protein
MHPRTEEVLRHLDTHRASLRAAVESVPPGLQTRRSADGTWSVTEIVEHLGIVERRIAKLFTDRLEEARSKGLGPETGVTPLVPTLDDAGLLDRRRPLVAGEAVQPRGELSMAEAWSALDSARARLRQAILEADGLALSEVSAPHARLGSLNLYQWLIFLGSHEGRHAAQIRETAAILTA